MDTQDIRDATQNEESDKLFFLLVATPRNPPKTFHKKLVQPFLHARGWEKISYSQTGFRALYFFHDKEENIGDDDLLFDTSSSVGCLRCSSIENANALPPKKPKLQLKEEKSLLAKSIYCSICNGWTSLQRATCDRDKLKKAIQNYKVRNGGTFEVHLILSKPVDDGQEFLEIASQPNAIE